MKFALALIATASASNVGNLMTEGDYKFVSFVAEHGRSYATKAEYQFRSAIFQSRIAEHETHNSKGLGWTLGVNHLTDRTEAEIKKLNGYKTQPAATAPRTTLLEVSADPALIDWRVLGAVTPVKD
jgi:KDEL-tailed cysteine endopeptidase